jgi:hypothetical protein
MAKIFLPPEEVGEPPQYESDMNIQELFKREDAWVEKVAVFCRKWGNPSNKTSSICGEEIQFGVADGKARYLVLCEKPLRLIHLPLGDAYQFPYVNRLTLKDVREKVAYVQRLKKLFS